MAKSLANAKLFASFSQCLASAITRQSHSVSSSQAIAIHAASRTGRRETWKKVEERIKEEISERSWIPDPVTGHYRPENASGVTDPVELRRILLNWKN